jgi:hypothetical protein
LLIPTQTTPASPTPPASIPPATDADGISGLVLERALPPFIPLPSEAGAGSLASIPGVLRGVGESTVRLSNAPAASQAINPSVVAASSVAQTTTFGSGAYRLNAAPGTYVELSASTGGGTSGYVRRSESREMFTVTPGNTTEHFILPSLDFAPAGCEVPPCYLTVFVTGYQPTSNVLIYLIPVNDPLTFVFEGFVLTDSLGSGSTVLDLFVPGPGEYYLAGEQFVDAVRTGEFAQPNRTLTLP